MNNQARIQHMQEQLQKALQPTKLEIIDESPLHAGHEGAKTGKGHFAITIASPAFQGKTLIQQHRLIYSALGDFMDSDIHALRINCK